MTKAATWRKLNAITTTLTIINIGLFIATLLVHRRNVDALAEHVTVMQEFRKVLRESCHPPPNLEDSI